MPQLQLSPDDHSGRLVNCYRPADLVLSLVYRASNLKVGVGVAGLAPVNASFVENVDVSSVVQGHTKYRHHVKEVLRLVGLEGEDRQLTCGPVSGACVSESSNGAPVEHSERPQPLERALVDLN